jgi:hypothetical protein
VALLLRAILAGLIHLESLQGTEPPRQHGPVPEISITFDPATRCYGFSTRLPGMRPHWMIDTFTSLEDVMRWVDPWRERVWEEPGEADESRILVSRSENPGCSRVRAIG